MNKKIVVQFLTLTFLIAIVSWGICAAFGLLGFTATSITSLSDTTGYNAPWLYIFIALCAFSPTIASYIVLKRNNEVKGFKEWLKNVFDVKIPFRFYLFVIVLSAVYYIPQIIIKGFEDAQPFYMFFLLLPLVLIGGGIEEAGWSYVLRPELDKKFGLVLSSLIIAVIWAAWHIPVFLPQGRIESLSWFGLFTIDILGSSFALGAIIRITKSVFLCVLFHTIGNAVSSTFYGFSDSLFGTIFSTVLLIVVSITAVMIYEKKNERIRN